MCRTPLYLNRIKPFTKKGNVKILTWEEVRQTYSDEGTGQDHGRPILLTDMELLENRRFQSPVAADVPGSPLAPYLLTTYIA